MTTNDILFITFLIPLSFLLTAGLSHLLSRPGAWFSVAAAPNERSLHTRPTPHTGGLAMVCALGLGWACTAWWQAWPDFMAYLIMALLPVVAISWWDDRHPLPALYRLLTHLLAAVVLLSHPMFVLNSVQLPGFVWSWPTFIALGFSLLFIVWMLNLYNFMDGMDGFAGGMAVFGFGTLAWLGGLHGDFLFCALNALVASSCAGFLVTNFPPAKIFMGDVGASFLGLLAAAVSLWGANAGIAAGWMSVLLFSPFILDATLTLLYRLRRGEKIWQAHRSHYYQRLVQHGWGHRKTVLWEYALMGACSLSVWLCTLLPPTGQMGILLLWLGIYVVLIWRLEVYLR